MGARANHSPTSPVAPAPVVLFGIDSNGKPKAARFGKDHAALAMKAASQLQLRVLPSSDPKIAAIVARLPVGRVHSTGRTLVPFVRRDLYDKLLAVALSGNTQQPPAPPASGTGGAASPKPPGGAPNRPANWQDIAFGDLVIAQESLEDGWYEAIVAEANDDMFTLRWRDYPRERRFVRNRHRLALLYPGNNLVPEGKPGKHDKAATHAPKVQSLPKNWADIQSGQLVLARAEGPRCAWWEAIPLEKVGDGFKLQWRDFPNLPPVTRPRFELALISPEAE